MAEVVCLRKLVPAGDAASWMALIEGLPVWAAREGDGFEPRSSSLRAVLCPGLALIEIAQNLRRGALAASFAARWGDDSVALAVDACWIRRQYPPSAIPAGHAPHGWHQDGALGARFDVPPEHDDARLLDLLTCWIALVPCGKDAPGLELAPAAAREARLDLAQLADLAERTDRRDIPTDRPTLAAGDALLFDGRVPHRTHITADMHGTRTSLELRFVRDPGHDHAPRIGHSRRLA